MNVWVRRCGDDPMITGQPPELVALEYSIGCVTCTVADMMDAVMVGLPGAAQDRLPADVPGTRPGCPGVPRRPGEGCWAARAPAREHQGIAQRVPDDELDAPRVTVTDLDGERILRKPLLGGLINEYTHAAWRPDEPQVNTRIPIFERDRMRGIRQLGDEFGARVTAQNGQKLAKWTVSRTARSARALSAICT
jgi:hypothetical protein